MKTLAAYTHSYIPGDIIFQEGDPGCTAYIIERGKVEVSITRKGERLVLAEYNTGDLFGEMALIDETPRSATVHGSSTDQPADAYHFAQPAQDQSTFTKEDCLSTLYSHPQTL